MSTCTKQLVYILKSINNTTKCVKIMNFVRVCALPIYRFPGILGPITKTCCSTLPGSDL